MEIDDVKKYLSEHRSGSPSSLWRSSGLLTVKDWADRRAVLESHFGLKAVAQHEGGHAVLFVLAGAILKFATVDPIVLVQQSRYEGAPGICEGAPGNDPFRELIAAHGGLYGNLLSKHDMPQFNVQGGIDGDKLIIDKLSREIAEPWVGSLDFQGKGWADIQEIVLNDADTLLMKYAPPEEITHWVFTCIKRVAAELIDVGTLPGETVRELVARGVDEMERMNDLDKFREEVAAQAIRWQSPGTKLQSKAH